MTKPLALIFYENLLTGNQLINRLNDLDYRAQAVSDLARFPDQAERDLPLVAILELGAMSERACAAIRSLRASAATAHIPVVAYAAAKENPEETALTTAAQAAGANLVVGEGALLAHLGQILDQALHLD
jgi:DNA-binding response OmpR family regulator